MRPVFVVLLVLVVVSGVLLAQELARNDAIPECTPQQAVVMLRLLDAAGVTPQLALLKADEEDNPTDFSFYLFDGYMKAWRDYDEDFKLRLPNCALALRFESAFYRLAGTQAYWYGANMLIETNTGTDSDDFLRFEEEVPGIRESAVEAFDTVMAELAALAGEAE